MDVWAFDGNPSKAIRKTKTLFNLTANDPAEIVKEMNEKMTSAKIVEHLMTMMNGSVMKFDSSFDFCRDIFLIIICRTCLLEH